MEIKVKNRHVKVSPKKVQPLLLLLRGCNASEAVDRLRYLHKSYAGNLRKLIMSAVASAKENDIETKDLNIKRIICEEGPRLKRHIYGSKGRIKRVQKRSSHLIVVLTDQSDKKDDGKSIRKKKHTRI